MREKKTERERSTEDAASRRKNYGERAVGLFGRFFSRMRGGESSYVQDSPGDTGRFCEGGGEEEKFRGHTLFTAMPSWCVAQKRKARGPYERTHFLAN